MILLSKPFRLPFLFVFCVFLGLISCKKNNGGSNGGRPVTPVTPTPTWDPNGFRGAWITTAASSALDSRDNIKQCVQTCKAASINNIFMVVYNNGRTTYPSTIMQHLIGIPILERYAGRDPLQEMIDEAHAAGIKIHAWFEYGFSSSYSANGGAIVAAKPTWAAKDINGNLVVKNGFDWLNAFNPEVQDYMISLFKEVATKYNVDGLQGDDRLPAVPSTSGYDNYTSNLYFLEKGVDPPTNSKDAAWVDWRAKKLNGFLKRLRTELKAIKPAMQLTMSPSPYPFSLTEYLQDWPTWVDSSWVDIVMPQCYRYDIAAYTSVLAQQKSYYRNTSVPLYPGVLVKSGTTLQSDAFMTQMIQQNRLNGFKGECFFFYEGIKDKVLWYQQQYPFIK
ncbi:MAG: family 10 glycosylhydrolase [Ferruginibacter sp.]|nr:family 10 glycosylhydrolase [Ferruginibacter sp.]